MSITRDMLRTAAKGVAQDAGPGDTATGVQLLLHDPDDYNQAIAQAIAQFNQDKPNLRIVDHTVVATAFRFPLTGASAILPLDPAAPDLPTVALAGTGAGNVDNGSHRWAASGVYTYGETELGEPSAALVVVDKATNGKVNVTITDPADVVNLLGFNIYRTAVNGQDFKLSGFQAFVAGPPTTTIYVDNLADASLTEEAPEESLAQQPDAWVDGASVIDRIWWPYDVTSQGDQPIDNNSYRMRKDPGGVIVLEFVADRPAATQVIRLEFTKPHVVDDDEPDRSTILRGDVVALATLAASFILQLAANKAAQNTGNTSLPNDVVDRRSQSDIYRSRSTELLKIYNMQIGKGLDAADVKGQSGFLDLDVEPSYRFGGLGGFVWHPSRTR